jgi:hypothetical protein
MKYKSAPGWMGQWLVSRLQLSNISTVPRFQVLGPVLEGVSDRGNVHFFP